MESPSCSPGIIEGKNLQNIRKEITGILFSEFLGKCADGSLVSARPLCSVDDASDQVFESFA